MQFTRTATAKAPDSNNAICEPEFYHARNMVDVQDYVNAFFTYVDIAHQTFSPPNHHSAKPSLSETFIRLNLRSTKPSLS